MRLQEYGFELEIDVNIGGGTVRHTFLKPIFTDVFYGKTYSDFNRIVFNGKLFLWICVNHENKKLSCGSYSKYLENGVDCRKDIVEICIEHTKGTPRSFYIKAYQLQVLNKIKSMITNGL